MNLKFCPNVTGDEIYVVLFMLR